MIKDFSLLKTILSIKEYRFLYILFFLMLIASLIETFSIGLLIPIISFFIKPDQSNKFYEMVYNFYSQFQLLSPILTIMITLLIVYLIRFIYLLYFAKVQGKYVLNLKASISKNLFEEYLLKPYTFHTKNNSSFLIRNVETEVGVLVNNFVQPFLVFSLNILNVFFITSLLLFYNFASTINIIITFSLVAIILNRIFKKKLTQIGKDRAYHVRFNLQHLRQGFGSIKEIKLLGIEDYFINKYNFHNFALAHLGLIRLIIGALPRLTFEYLFLILIFFLILFTEIKNESFQSLLPILIIYALAAFRLMPALNAISLSYQQMKYGVPSLEIVAKQFQLKEKKELLNKVYSKFNFYKEISLDTICFRYLEKNKKVLDNISFSIIKNEITGIIGSNGSGKSTLVNLICGLSEPTSGKIEVDGKNIHENLRGWQRLIGYVPQTVYLSDDTLLSNIAIGIDKSKINQSSLNRAIKLAQLDEMISELPEGLETKMGEQGKNISGGQKQKIGIARAIYRDPEILILDEATSSMDLNSEQSFMEEINKLASNKTIIMISHRQSPLKYCKKIYKINNQKIFLEK
tara:strand:+ start:511 stop:2232 length:1722 start_codon:yes stop_codon:yes gene_type:complete